MRIKIKNIYIVYNKYIGMNEFKQKYYLKAIEGVQKLKCI